jgi:hypothetical protein
MITLFVNTAILGNMDFLNPLTQENAPISETILNADNALNKKGSERLNIPVYGVLNPSGKGTYVNSDGRILPFIYMYIYINMYMYLFIFLQIHIHVY